MSKRLLQLLRDNAKAKAKMPLAVVLPAPKSSDANPDEAKSEAVLYLYDVIVSDDFWGGVSAEAFVRAMADASLVADVIHIRINSPGGDVFAARAMEAAIRGCPKHVVAHVDGYAASAASYVALAADEVCMAPGAFFMIHKAWCMAVGNAEDLMDTAALLEKIDASLVATYSSETKCAPDAIESMMAAETWIGADEAVDLGFADCVESGTAKASLRWNLAAYANAPSAEQTAAEDDTPTQDSADDALPGGEETGSTSSDNVRLIQTAPGENASAKAAYEAAQRRLKARRI